MFCIDRPLKKSLLSMLKDLRGRRCLLFSCFSLGSINVSWCDVFPIEYLEKLPKPLTVQGLSQAGLTVEKLRIFIERPILKYK